MSRQLVRCINGHVSDVSDGPCPVCGEYIGATPPAAPPTGAPLPTETVARTMGGPAATRTKIILAAGTCIVISIVIFVFAHPRGTDTSSPGHAATGKTTVAATNGIGAPASTKSLAATGPATGRRAAPKSQPSMTEHALSPAVAQQQSVSTESAKAKPVASVPQPVAAARPAPQATAVSVAEALKMYQRGMADLSGANRPPNFTRAKYWLHRSAATGFGDAMFGLGLMYEQGAGVPRSFKKAFYWFSKGAAAGSARAMSNLGCLYANGRGVLQNFDKAMAWFRKGAAAGSRAAMDNIGVMYQHGDGVPPNYAKAVAWYRKGAAAGSGRAMYRLGWMYAKGQGVPKWRAEAVYWWGKSAIFRGYAPAEYYFGAAYAYGKGIPADRPLALLFLREAAAQGGPFGFAARKLLAKLHAGAVGKGN